VRGDGAPMAYALYFGFTDIAELLAQHGARLDLRFAAGLGKLDVVESFFNADGSLRPDAGSLADPYENRWRCERTRANVLSQALFFACLHGRLEVADLLLQQGAELDTIVPGLDPNAPGTVLHHLTVMSFGAAGDHNAIEQRRLPTVEFLLKRGASVTIRDPLYHSTPLGWARHFGREQITTLLLPHAGIHDAVALDAIDRVRALLADDPALANARDDLGQTPLHHLHADVRRGDESIDLLVARGADVNARDDEGKTPLHKVLSRGRTDHAERLRSHGATTDAR
jgi:ankyrin repeat protein